ncbi:MAG: hypothetical protein LV479_01320 [Methylacidiphilales bacterium]|nr:hypothetical protein [Candidatus Methylacidiphilales bacterium]
MTSRAVPLTSRRWKIVLWIYLGILVVLLGTYTNTADADLWHLFALYDYLLKTGHFPPGDTFSYLADYRLVPDHEWGCAFVFAPLYFVFGPASLIFLKLALLFGTVGLTIRAGLGRRSPTMLEAFFYSLVTLTLLSSFLSTVRCEVFTHLFFALWLLWYQLERRGRHIPSWAYGLTMIAWANLHGGFILGLAWLAAVAAIEFFSGGNWIRHLRILGLCLLATLANPFGYELWVGVGRALLISRSSFDEWSPVPWLYPYNTFLGYKMLAGWTAVIVIGHVRLQGWKNCDRIAVILPLLFFVASILQVRHTSLFAVAAGGLLPPLFPPELSWQQIHGPGARLHRLAVRTVLFVLPLVLAMRLLPASQGFHLTYPSESCPAQAVAYLHDHDVRGRLLVDLNAGSYALWKLQNQMQVSIDGRYDLVYRPRTFNKVENFFHATGDWRRALTDPPPDAVLVNLSDPVYPRMRAEPGWTEVYRNSSHAVFRPGAIPLNISHP